MSRATSFDRLAKLYSAMERARAHEVSRATSDLEQARATEAEQMLLLRRAGTDQLSALNEADPVGWHMHRAETSLVGKRLQHLAPLIESRKEALLVAAEAHRACEVQREQMKSLADREQEEKDTVATRRQQLEMDDRYASRRSWTQDSARLDR